VRADATRLKLLLRNLVDNALRHGGDAAPPPQVFLRARATAGWRWACATTARAWPTSSCRAWREAFYRPDSARTRSAGGVGLGLYLCRLVAQAHGGELRIRNAAPGLEVAMVWAPAG
jgi:signal transduction histidine kinase